MFSFCCLYSPTLYFPFLSRPYRRKFGSTQFKLALTKLECDCLVIFSKINQMFLGAMSQVVFIFFSSLLGAKIQELY